MVRMILKTVFLMTVALIPIRAFLASVNYKIEPPIAGGGNHGNKL